MRELLSQLVDTSGLLVLYQPEALLYLAMVLLLLWLGRGVYARTIGYNLMEAVAVKDNQAATLSFVGYFLGLGLTLWGVLTAHGMPSLVSDLVDMVGFGVLAVVLLHLGQWVTDRLAFPRTALRRAIRQGNLAAGLVEGGGYLSTGLILRSAVGVHGVGLSARLLETLLFFGLAQLAFVLFVRVHQAVTRYDVHAEIGRGNAAAGISQALTFAGQGVLLGYAIAEAHSLVVFLVWFLLSSLLLVLFRFFVDRLMLPGHSLDKEVASDQNWGLALLEGAGAVVVSLILTGAF